MKPIIAGLALCMSPLACGTSPPVQYYVLDTAHPVAMPVDVVEIPIRVAIVRIPSDLDRQEMVRESAATQLTVSDQHRWAAPLGEMMTRVLTQDLAERLPRGMVVFPQEPAPTRVNDLVVDALDFGRDSSGVVVFNGSWSLVPTGSDTPLVRRHIMLREPDHSASYSEQVRAMSRILGVLSDTIVANLSSTTASRSSKP